MKLGKKSNSASRQASLEQIPLYVRWTPEGYSYALEMSLDLVTRITANLAQAEALKIEIGGVLIGVLPSPASPVLRVDDLTIIARRAEDGPIYMLDPGQDQQLSEIGKAAAHQNLAPVGFFRSHWRPGPLAPSMADRTLLGGQFLQSDYVLLLVQGQQPRTAAFFLAAAGHLPDQPSVRKFFFDTSEFKRLPEVPLEPSARGRTGVAEQSAQSVQPGHRWVAWLSFAALFFLALFVVFSGAITRSFRPDSNKLNLAATSQANVLQITWDHNCPFILGAKSALLTINDGASHREMMLAPDELKLGQVDYERLGGKVSVVFKLDSPGSDLPPQTLDWSQN